MVADRFSNPLDERLEALADEPGEPGRRSAPARATLRRRRSDRLGAPATGEGSLTDVATELRGLREAFLSLPPLDDVDDRLVEIETRVDGLTAGMDQVLDRLVALEAMLSALNRPADVADVSPPAKKRAPRAAPSRKDEGAKAPARKAQGAEGRSRSDEQG